METKAATAGGFSGHVWRWMDRQVPVVMALLVGVFEEFCAAEPVVQDTEPVEVCFENADADVAEEGGQIIAVAADRFRQITGKPVGRLPVHVQFVENLEQGVASRSGTGRLQGVTLYGEDSCDIQISTRRTSSWKRILAHEITHVFAREAYGRVRNITLSEGLAEYIAGQIVPVEVQRDLRNATTWATTPSFRPYVEGYHFCRRYAGDSRFPEFLATQMTEANHSYGQLRCLWDSQPPAPKD